MAYCLKLQPSLGHHFKDVSSIYSKKSNQILKLRIHSCAVEPKNVHKLVAEVREKLEKEHNTLPVGKNGRDDEDMILWFLKDRNFSVEDAVPKLTKAIRWRHEVGVSELSEESVKSVAETGKAYVHAFLDIYGRPVLIVEASKHFPGKHKHSEDEMLSAFLIEKALSKLPDGKQEILGIIDLRGFRTKNTDIKFLTFVIDAFYCYYPRRLGQVLFVEAPFVFKPVWLLVEPLLRSSSPLKENTWTDPIISTRMNDEITPKTTSFLGRAAGQQVHEDLWDIMLPELVSRCP